MRIVMHGYDVAAVRMLLTYVCLRIWFRLWLFVVSMLFRVILSFWAGQKLYRLWSWIQRRPVQLCCIGCQWLSVGHHEANSLLPLNSFWLCYVHLFTLINCWYEN